MKRALLMMLLAVGATTAQAQQAPKPETVIKWRQSAFQVVAWNNARIKFSLEGAYNKDEVARAANAIAAVANAGVGTLFPPGTEQGSGWHETKVKRELFQDPKRAAELTASFSTEANELARLADAGDLATLKAQFGKLNRTCKACHDDFRHKD